MILVYLIKNTIKANTVRTMSGKTKRKVIRSARNGPKSTETTTQESEDVSPYFKDSSQQHSSTKKLGQEFFDQECILLCKALLGKVLCRRVPGTDEVLRGTIVETEAYPGGEDRASQSYQGRRTERNEAMFMAPGTAYVYFTYGMYFCFNISAQGEGAACLIRAAEPLEDYETMHQLRAKKRKEGVKRKRLSLHELANGPSKLCMAFDIRRENCDKIDMSESDELWLEESEDLNFKERKFEIQTDRRIGIDSTPMEARNKLWRFFVKDSWAESRAKVGELTKRQKLAEQQGN